MRLNLKVLWRIRAFTISMRAYALFPALLAAAGLSFAFTLLPASLSARAAKRHDAPQKAVHPKPAHPKPGGRPRSNVHKARRQEKHAALGETSQPKLPEVRASVPDRVPDRIPDGVTADRVHSWVRSQQTAAAVSPNPEQPDDGRSPRLRIETWGTQTVVPESVVLPTLYNRRGRLIVPPPLKGSHEILVRQNLIADSDGLERIGDDADLERMRTSGMLVPLPTNNTLHTDERLPANRRYCRPWTALFLDTLARQHFARFQSPLQVNSAVRTVEFQQRLIHSNGNAAPAEGDTASPHLTGQAVDIAKHGLSLAEIAWLRGYLLPLVQQGKVDVEEEFQQSCFHISVYKSYMPQTPRRVIATTHREGIGTLGMSLK